MAIHKTGTETVAPTMEASLGKSGAEAMADNLNNNSIKANAMSFNNKLFTMSSNMGSDYTNKFANLLLTSYSQLAKADMPRVNILDKEVLGKLAYSVIVVSMLSAEDTVNYYTIILEATGRESQTAETVVGEVQAVMRSQATQQNLIYVTSDANDAVLADAIGDVLRKEWGGKTPMSIEGLVVRATEAEAEVIAPSVASVAFNAINTEKALASGQIADLNIGTAVQESSGTLLRLEANTNKPTSMTETGAPVRSDFIVDLTINNVGGAAQSLNMQNAKTVLTRSTGFVDAIPEAIQMPAVIGMPPVTRFRLRPHIIVTSNQVTAPTTGYALLGLVSSLVMTNDNMWLATLMPKDGKLRNVGALNMLTNIENDVNGIGAQMDLADKKTTAEETYAFLRQMFSEDPIVSYDIESFGPETHYSNVFALAAQPNNTNAKQNAADEIIKVANWLTNGNFPANYNRDDIFANAGIIIPGGTWQDKNGERDLRDVDAAMIATRTGNMDMINKWTLTGLPQSATGLDPYLERVELISKVIPSAVITSKIIRVMFSANFINTLMNAVMNAGLDVTYDPQIKFAEQNDLAIIGGYTNAAGLGANTAGFARQHIQQGASMTTPYAPYTGHGRY